MKRLSRSLLTTTLAIAVTAAFIVTLPSLIGLMLAVILTVVCWETSSQRRRAFASDLNSALRAVCHRQGAIEKVAVAFSRRGPLRAPCYEYARRLMAGEDPLEAATAARVPLELATAVAMQTTAPSTVTVHDEFALDDDFSDRDPAGMPVRAQLMYLMLTAVVTVLMLTFVSVFVLPSLEKMWEEFGIDLRYRQWLSRAPALVILSLVSVAVLIIFPFVSRADRLGIRLPSWLTMPSVASRNADMLRGLADAVDAGWPVGRALAVRHSISLSRNERARLERAMRSIEQGDSAARGLVRAGWIRPSEESWLVEAPPHRIAARLRMIAGQSVRDANANLRWIMSIAFPGVVIVIAIAVLIYAFGFLGNLAELILALS